MASVNYAEYNTIQLTTELKRRNQALERLTSILRPDDPEKEKLEKVAANAAAVRWHSELVARFGQCAKAMLSSFKQEEASFSQMDWLLDVAKLLAASYKALKAEEEDLKRRKQEILTATEETLSCF